MFHQGALGESLRRLRGCHVELRLCLRDIEACGDAGIVTLLRQAQRVCVGFDRIIEYRAIAVETAQLNVVIDQLGDER